ncbi:MAG: thermonuclease family protein [Planctomycetota bacterium]|nr:thermonuclease family protein [Planctomycetota bacterium]
MTRTRLALLALVVGVAPLRADEPPTDPLRIGVHKLRADGIVDGDTLRVDGLKRSLRVLHIDTEEVPHSKTPQDDVAVMRSDFAAYAKTMQGSRLRPLKYPTPAGEAASAYAKKILPRGATLLLERDSEGAPTKGSYGRTICHVWVVPKDGESHAWLFAERMIRAGHSPYYMKYGRSSRFDDRFRDAQAEAQKHKRGIWSDEGGHYPDYEQRLAWWERRATALAWYAEQQRKGKAPIQAGSKNAIRKLSRRVGNGKRVAVFGLIDDKDAKWITRHGRGATLRIGGERYIEIEIVGTKLARELDLDRLCGEMVLVEGLLDREGNRLNEKLRYMRIPVTDAKQIRRIPAPGR